MKLKKSLNFRAYFKEEEILYFDGETKKIEVDKIEGFWELLELIKDTDIETIKGDIDDWRQKYGVSMEELQEILEYLSENGLLYEPESNEKLQLKEINSRNFNFFSIYDNSLHSNKLLKKIKNSNVLIIGAGTIGATLASVLCNLGVGKLQIIDFDTVQLKNINAQTVFNMNDVGKKKNNVIKEKLLLTNPYLEIEVYDEKLEDIDDLLKLNIKDVDYILGCFDETSEKFQIDLIRYADSIGSNYIKTGYLEEKIVVATLTGEHGVEIIKKSYAEYPNKFIKENSGTIVHALASSLLVTKVLINHLIFDKYVSNKVYTSSVFEYMNISKNDNADFVESLNEIMLLDSNVISNRLTYIQSYVQTHNELPRVLEDEILTYYQLFEILDFVDFLGRYNLRGCSNQVSEIIASCSNDNMEDEVEAKLLNEYYEILEKVTVKFNDRSYNIFDALYQVNDLESYEQRKILQKNIFFAIEEYADILLDILRRSKLNQIIKQDHLVFKEIYGMDFEQVQIFDAELNGKIQPLVQKILLTLFPQPNKEKLRVDYLYYNPKTNQVHNIEEAEKIIVSSLKYKNLNNNMLFHINKMFKNGFIKTISSEKYKNIFRNFYFPTTKESRIVVDYSGKPEQFITLCHEIGHSYFNPYYPDNYFDVSSRIVNEVIAIFFELVCVESILENPSLDPEFKNALAFNYIMKINKIIVSNYSIYRLEREVNRVFVENQKLNGDSFLQIQDQVLKSSYFNKVTFENNKYSQFNILLMNSFVFGLEDYIIDSFAFLIANLIFQYYKNDENIELKMKDALSRGFTTINPFVKHVLNERVIMEVIPNSFDKLNDLIVNLNRYLDSHECNQ